ncbi:MAG: succinylglutamate desuccinylase [Enterobacterales bacterium]|nr:succinylglutamate desuccinylase [Enterobacterales bacterium]
MLFSQHWASFLSSGQFLKLTRAFEDPLQRTETFVLNRGITGRLHDTGILSFTPQSKSDTFLLISSGIHGNETAPIEMVDQLCQAIIKGELEVKVNLMLIIGNPAAIDFGQRFVEQNLNRLFCGLYKKQSSFDYEVKRAEMIEKSVYQFFAAAKSIDKPKLYHLDMHTAIRTSKYQRFALCPYLDGRPLNQDFISIFGGSGLQTLLLGNQPAGTFSYFTSHIFKANSATLELGKVRPFGENDSVKFLPVKTNLEKMISAQLVTKKSF